MGEVEWRKSIGRRKGRGECGDKNGWNKRRRREGGK